MIKRLAVLICVIALMLSGCAKTDYTEPEDRTIVTALIAEYKEEYIITAETVSVPDNAKESSFKGENLIGRGDNLQTAFKTLQQNFSKELSFFHCPLIICSKDTYVLKKDELQSFLFNNSQLSLSINLVLCEDAQEFTKIELKEGEFLGYEITELIDLKNIDAKFIDISRKKTTPPLISVGSENKFEISENANE